MTFCCLFLKKREKDAKYHLFDTLMLSFNTIVIKLDAGDSRYNIYAIDCYIVENHTHGFKSYHIEYSHKGFGWKEINYPLLILLK